MATVHAIDPSENWDDDFEFSRTNNTTTNNAMIHDGNAYRTSIVSSDWDNDNDDHSNTKMNMVLEDRTNTMNLSSKWIEPGPSTPRRTNNTENWDDDFEDSPIHKTVSLSPGKDKASPLRLRRKQPRPESWDDEFEAEAQALQSDDEMGYAERDEEDRTVTARLRRSPARLSNSPPPVPAIPLPFLLPSPASGPSPFPRSPTSSVFSVPTVRPPSSAFTATSTTHLRPTPSRSSSGFDALPPSPPIHRERRRLRKKSRPQGNTIELAVIRAEYGGEPSEGDVRPTTPPPAAQSIPATPGSSGGAGALLSRIGSMKKWGVRRRKGSTAPSETEERDVVPRPIRPQSQASISSASSSASSHHQDTQHPSMPHVSNSGKRSSTIEQGPSWFFRSASSPFSPDSTSELDLPVQLQTPTKSRKSKTDEATPAKLVKRKSLGFVQLKRGFPGVGGHGNENERGREGSMERTGEKYGGLGRGCPTENQKGNEGSVFPDEKREGSRSFIRRLSLAGRHRRTKSGVSLQNVVGLLDVVGFGNVLRDENITPTPESVAVRRESKATPVTPSKTPTPKPTPAKSLLPPIELQPPSPHRVRPAAPGPENAKPRVTEAMLSPSASLPTVSSNASLSSPTPSTSTSVSPSRRNLPSIGSPQAVSLGRSSIGPEVVIANAVGLRRSSLGDLKIPERISQAQVGLRKDMERVREFAAGVEKLKALQVTYEKLVTQVQDILDQQHHQQQLQQIERQQQLERHQYSEKQSTRPSTPRFFANLSRPLSRNRSRSTTKPPPPTASTVSLAPSLAFMPPPASAPAAPVPTANAYKQLASAYYTIRSKYRISWECAELLIELGSGSNTSDRGPTSSMSVPVMPLSGMHKPGRERAITLNGEDAKPLTPSPGQGLPPSVSSPGIGLGAKAGWRASTGKHDLSQRQLVLLKEILSGGDGSGAEEVSIPEEIVGSVTVNREWRWGKDGMESTLTLPSEDSSAAGEGASSSAGGEVTKKGKLKKRRPSRLRMSGLKDILRSFTRTQDQENANANAPMPPLPPSVPASTTSLNTSTTDDSMDSHFYQHRRVSPSYGRRRPQTSSGPGEFARVGRPASPYTPSLHAKPSPRRPSLASIFRIGRGSKPATPEVPPGSHPSSRSTSRQDSSTGEEEDWDRLEDAEDDIVLGKMDQDTSATVRGKGKVRGPGHSSYLQDGFSSLPYLPGRTLTPKRSVSGSQSSIWGEGSNRSASNGSAHGGLGSGTTPPRSRVTKLSNVEEDVKSRDVPQYQRYHRPPPGASSRSSFNRPPAMESGSVRSMPPHPVMNALPDPTLAMTPENIRPLLENARGVQVKLGECIAEVKALLQAYPQS